MTPPLPHRALPLLAAASLLLTLLAGCEKSADEEDDAPSRHQAQAAPSPSPVSTSAERTGRKALSAFNAVSGYLKEQDPDLRAHLQKAATKFVKDKDKWRERLTIRQRDLQPKINRLRDQLTRAEGQSADALRNLRQELSSLESQRADAENKLSELEAVTTDTWNSFRAHLDVDGDETASPTPGKR